MPGKVRAFACSRRAPRGLVRFRPDAWDGLDRLFKPNREIADLPRHRGRACGRLRNAGNEPPCEGRAYRQRVLEEHTGEHAANLNIISPANRKWCIARAC